MARAAKETEERPPHDAMEGISLPRETQFLVGHDAAERILLDAYRSGRIHHAWLLLGQRGIGRATLAFRFARFVFAHPEPGDLPTETAGSLAVDPNDAAARRVARGVHPNLLHLQREWDEKGKRYRSEISVETIRRITPFLGTTAAEGGWRIVIIDTADEMNRSAANALLKNLEEPPRRTIFLLLAESRGSLLPTIISRCRTLRLERLSEADIMRALETLGAAPGEGLERDVLLTLSEGSPRRTIELLRQDGLRLHRLLRRAVERGEAPAQHELSAMIAEPSSNRYQQFLDLFFGYLGRRIHRHPEPGGGAPAPSLPLVTWAELWEKATLSGRDVEAYNLDRRQFILDLLETAAAAVNRPGAPALR